MGWLTIKAIDGAVSQKKCSTVQAASGGWGTLRALTLHRRATHLENVQAAARVRKNLISCDLRRWLLGRREANQLSRLQADPDPAVMANRCSALNGVGRQIDPPMLRTVFDVNGGQKRLFGVCVSMPCG